ncbi:MAG: SHOCT domain-containing protein [Sulfuricella denitrificans]|nr:SHOCT domain-containing protein [Sulfuricella denitrificans]
MWGYMGNHDWGWGGMGFGMVIFWALLIALIVALVRGVSSSGGGSPERREEKTALDILKERYARGEIGKDEFEQKKRDLGG